MRYLAIALLSCIAGTVNAQTYERRCVNGQCVLVQVASPAPAPVEPVTPPADPAPVENHGIDLAKLKEGQGGYSVNGQRVDRNAAYAAIEANVPDLSHKRRIVVVGDESSRKAALAAIGTPDWAVVQAYPADNWYVQRVGYQPGVTVTDPDGKVVHRQKGIAELPGNLERVRTIPIGNPVPNPAPYDPAGDPDLTPRVPPAPVAPVTPAILPLLLSSIHWPSGIGGALLMFGLSALGAYLKQKQGGAPAVPVVVPTPTPAVPVANPALPFDGALLKRLEDAVAKLATHSNGA